MNPSAEVIVDRGKALGCLGWDAVGEYQALVEKTGLGLEVADQIWNFKGNTQSSSHQPHHDPCACGQLQAEEIT